MTIYPDKLREIESLANAANRDPKEIQTIVVSKGRAIPELLPLYEEGALDFGENRFPEALEKQEAMPASIRWHFIGRLQRNKVRKLIGRFFLIHSVDSFPLAEKIATVSQEEKWTTSILLQVNCSGEAQKAGFAPEEIHEQVAKIKELEGIEVRGLMTMAPLTEDQRIIRACFRKLALLRKELSLPHLSMGMSEDYPIAIEEGATLLRIGRAFFSSS